jgi:hypothetical protein
MDANAIIDVGCDEQIARGALNTKRYVRHDSDSAVSREYVAANPYWFLDTSETKTAWHPTRV